MKGKSELNEPHVGIFWSYENRIFHIESSPLSKGIRTLVSIDYAVGHYAAWFLMAKRGILNRLPAFLRDEYDSIPRGRVVYLFENRSFVIYHGDEFSDVQYRSLIDSMNLPQDRTIDVIDEHYNPLPDDFLF